jgi:molybdopterin molybdotransferase
MGYGAMTQDTLSVSQAVERLLEGVHPLEAEEVNLEAAQGRVLAGSVVAPIDLPPFAHSSMDGFAVRAADVSSADPDAPVELTVSGDIAAGADRLPSLKPGEAIRIMTGGPIPEGADCVVPVEHTGQTGPMAGAELPSRIQVLRASVAEEYVRPSGLDVKRGQVVLEAGHRLRPQDLGLLASLGVAKPSVVRQPRVAVLSTGDELVPVDAPLSPGKIRDSNGVTIRSFVRRVGGVALELEIAADTQESVLERLNQSVAQGADLILSTAGVSMGAYDFVRSVLEAHGELAFWRVNIRPGKPLAFGSFEDIPFLGLPGNPVSAWVTFAVFVWPLIERLEGARGPERWQVEAIFDEDVESDGRESYLRAHVRLIEGEYHAALTGSQDSGVMTSLVSANALAIIPAGVTHLAAGSKADVWMLGGPR